VVLHLTAHFCILSSSTVLRISVNMSFNSTIAYQLEHPGDNQQKMIQIVTGVMIGLASFSMVLRWISRWMKKQGLGLDDHTMLVGYIFFIVYQAFQYNVIRYGFGRHTAYITDVKGFTIALLSLEVTYNPSIVCIKASILILYNNLFVNRKLKYTSLTLWIFTCCYSITQFFGELFSCYPIASNWDPTVKGHCIQLSTVVVICSILNIITDIAILALPMPFLWRLQMSWTRKIQLIGIFLLGGFVCFVSIYRATLVHTVSLLDPAWSDVNGALWSGIELAVAIISGNLPICRPLYNRVFNHGSTNSGSRGVDPSTNNKSYPRLRPSNNANDTWAGHSNFERLGPSVDGDSVELKGMKKVDKKAIVVTTNIRQEVGLGSDGSSTDRLSTHSKADIL